MQIFQRNILKKYIEGLNPDQVEKLYRRFANYFLNPERQENIQNSKEEQFQEGFLRELFVQILGYILNPDPDFNLTTEKKNETNSKKADGAILVDGKVVGVVELKDHKTTDLSKVEAQAFNYKSQHKDADYVVISNFEKLRFYIDNAVDYEEFDLFHLTKEDLARLWICLAYESIAKNLPKQIKEASVNNENRITNALYKDYSNFKRDLFEDILKNNPTDDTDHKILLFKKTQKLLDRLLFILFAEDRGLLPPNSLMMVINQWEKLKDFDAYQPFYERLKKYFGYMNTGFQGKNYEVFAYNGGLFKPDEVLDGLKISDELLRDYCKKLSDYDFASDVDVNILGHIFENSLTEIEEITTKLQQGEAPTISKRKKDGVFYTPQYITKYIVENTVGKLCREKKAELGIDESEYFTDKKRQVATKKALVEKLDAYRDWLLQISICDPACGSGAFLNAALNFLIAEHKLIDEMQAKVQGATLVFPNVENSILENNLYGVDINEESVEIAKLSLWLRTAKPHRKLNSLNNNIKCGNSLIDDPAIAGDKAFNWQTEFPKVFEKGGFDVVIGNPPYVRAELLPQADLNYYSSHYQVFTPDGDLFSYFYEKGMNLLKTNGLFSFISNTFDKTAAGKSLRSYIQFGTTIERYTDFTEVQIFEGATTYPVILLLSKKNNSSNAFPYIKIPKEMQSNIVISLAPEKMVEQQSLDCESWSFQDAEMANIMKKIATHKTVKEQYGKCYYGVKTALNDAFFIDESTKDRLIAEDPKSAELIKPVYEGKDLQKWHNPSLQKYLICTHNGYESQPAVDVEQYPAIKAHLQSFEPKLSARYDKGNTPFNLRNCAYQGLFYQSKIIWGNLQNTNKFSWEENGTVISAPACMLPTNNKALLAVLNSKIVWKFLTSICVVRNGGYIEVKPQYFEQIPIPPIPDNSELSEITSTIIDLTDTLQQKRQRFLRRLKESMGVQKITASLERFDENDFKAFVAELKKQKITLTLTQQDEWEDYFNKYKVECNALSAQIAVTDKEIDRQVYDLYGLTPDEIKVVEGE